MDNQHIQQHIATVREALRLAPVTPWAWDRWEHDADHILIKDGRGQAFLGDPDLDPDDAQFISNSPTWLQQSIDMLDQQQREIERLKTCPDCGGTGIVEYCHDPYYGERCICTVDWMQETSELNKKLADKNRELAELKNENSRMREELFECYVLLLAQEKLARIEKGLEESTNDQT